MKDTNIAILKLGNLNIEVPNLYDFDIRKDLSQFNHAHSFYEIHFVLEGWVKINVEGKIFVIEKNKIFFVPKRCSHFCEEMSNDFSTCSLCFDFSFAGKSKERPVHEYGYFTRLFSAREFTVINFSDYEKTLILNVYQNVNNFSVYSVHKINTEATNLFLEIGKKFSEIFCKGQKEEPSSISNDQNSSRKNLIENYIVNNLKNASLEGLSNNLHLSIRQTSRFLAKYYGKTFRHILIEARIRYAEPLVKEKVLSLKEIAKKSGFKSYKQFCECYLEYFGRTL